MTVVMSTGIWVWACIVTPPALSEPYKSAASTTPPGLARPSRATVIASMP